MPLPSAIKLFIDPRNGLAFGNFSGSSQITKPTFTLGDTAGFEIYLVESTQVTSYPRQEVPFPVSPGIKVAVGAIDEAPLSGTWTMSFGGNTTTALAFNVTAAQVQTALNALASITAAGGVTVSKIGDNYNITFNQNGARDVFTTDGSALVPLSSATVAVLQAGSSTKPCITMVHLQRTVAGLATTFTQTAASQISIESLGAWDGSKATYRVSISPDPKGGSFTLAFDAQTGDDVSTSSINVGAAALDVQNALSTNALADKVTVTQVGAYSYDITVSVQPGTSGLTANDSGILSFNGYKGDLSLNTAEAISLLDGADSIETVLEVEITSDSKTLTLLQIPCVLKNAVIDAGSIEPLVLDTYLSQTTADGRYLRQSNNLSDLGSASTARTNLGVYSTSQVDTALALKASDADLLLKADLAGASFTGAVTTTDRMAIGGGLAINPAHKLAIYNGSIVFSAGYGLAFGDGTVQTTAFTGSAGTSWGSITGTLASQTDLSTALSGKAATVHTHSISDVTALQTALDGKAATSHTQAISTITGLQTALDGKAASVHTHTISDVTGLQTALDAKAALAGATFTGTVNGRRFIGQPNANVAAFNLGVGATDTASTTAGDLWLPTGSSYLNYRDAAGVWRNCLANNQSNSIDVSTATAPALRITQRGAANALVVEDEVSPDGTPFVITATGAVAIGGTSPGAYKLNVTGTVYATSIESPSVTATSLITNNIQLNAGGQLTSIGTGSTPFGGNLSTSDYPLEMIITLNPGAVYAIPCRQVTG